MIIARARLLEKWSNSENSKSAGELAKLLNDTLEVSFSFFTVILHLDAEPMALFILGGLVLTEGDLALKMLHQHLVGDLPLDTTQPLCRRFYAIGQEDSWQLLCVIIPPPNPVIKNRFLRLLIRTLR